MGMIDRIRRALVIAPHPDDEVLGCGGTMARLAAGGAEVHVAIVTRGSAPRFNAAHVKTVEAEARRAHQALGIAQTHFLDFPAAELDRVSHADLNVEMTRLVSGIEPDTLFLPFIGDVHLDHQLVFTSGMVAARPNGPEYPVRIYAYETLSETNWHASGITPAFNPNVFVDITGFLERKLKAFMLYQSQVRAFPNERSVEALRALAMMRGATMHRAAAEAFMLVRELG